MWARQGFVRIPGVYMLVGFGEPKLTEETAQGLNSEGNVPEKGQKQGLSSASWLPPTVLVPGITVKGLQDSCAIIFYLKS
jgi:hypothetical protein